MALPELVRRRAEKELEDFCESPIRLEPISPTFPPIVLSHDQEVTIVAELIDVLGPGVKS